MLGFSWLIFVGVLYLSQADVRVTTNNENDISSNLGSSAENFDSTGTKWKQSKDFTPPYVSDVDMDLLNSDYIDDPVVKTSTTTAYGQVVDTDTEEPVPIEEVLVTKVKGPCLGCPIQSDTENPKIKDIAQFAFAEFSKGLVGDDPFHQFVRVLKAESQVVAGIKYFLQIEIGWTNCTRSQHDQDSDMCQLDPTKETFTCDFQVVEKSWLNTKEVVNSKCHKEKQTNSVDSVDYDLELLDQIEAETTVATDSGWEYEVKDRKKREAEKFGRLKEADESKEVIGKIAKFAVDQLDETDDDNNARLIVDVIQAKKQTVSGWLYHLQLRVAQTTCLEGEANSLEKCKDKIILPFTICDVKVLFQPWQTSQYKLTESQCRQEKYKKSKKIAKQLFKRQNTIVKEYRQRPTLIGGKDINPDSPDIIELTTFAIDSLDEASNAMHAQKLVRVVSARRQLVSGIRTTLEIEIGYTTCRKNPNLDKSKCDLDESRDHQYCNLTVIEKPWIQEKKLAESKCGKRETPVGIKIKRGIKMEDSAEDSISSSEEVDEHEEQFGHFAKKFGKHYATEKEYQFRLGVFKENMKKVKMLQETEQGTATYGATHFADLTEEEFSKMHLGLRPDLRITRKRKQAKIPVLRSIPVEFDWRNYSAVTPVKNQGSCGSCWAFSVSGNIEGAYAIKHGNLESFSEQELVDCDTLDEGCNGGLPENAYKILEKLGGLETEREYPYEGRDEKCHFNSKLAKAKVSGFVEVSKNETEMAAWLVKNGPISIGINANAMQFYFGGVSHPFKFLCSPKSLDHGVLIVGYGVHTTSIRHKTLPYWIVKNSWGPGWGEKGYYRVYRGDGTCGVNQMATSALIM